MSQVEELDTLLQSLQALKPPGASKSKIAAITQLCVDNPHLDSVIAQKLYSNFKRSSPTHKLGILFVVDSVARQFFERARGQEHGHGSTTAGMYASGVQRLTELLPSLVDDTIRLAPQEQKAKVQNLVDIWERSNIFPAKLVADFKKKLQGPAPYIPSRTPPGSPPAQLLQYLGLRKPAATQPPPTNGVPTQISLPPNVSSTDAAGLLRALAGIAAQNPPAPAPVPQPAAPSSQQQDLNALLAGFAQYQSAPSTQSVAPPSYPQFAYQPQPTPSPAYPPQMPTVFPGASMPQAPPPPPPAMPQQPAAEDLASIIARLVPPHILADPEKAGQVAQLFDGLLKNGIPQEQWAPVLQALYPQGALTPAPAPVPAIPSWHPAAQNGSNEQPHGSYNAVQRERSRSPDYRSARGGGNRRQSPVYGSYDGSSGIQPVQQDIDVRAGQGKRNGNRYRQRSPPRNGSNVSANVASREKWLSYDPTLPPGHIKVLSRTLFVGGCSARDAELRRIFETFGPVQTCITNLDKRHAFVKMATREGAVAARNGMEDLSQRDPNLAAKARQTKWGVGFGPRDCCDYSNGESTIPIASLTEADIKWALTAEHGGTGGRDIVPGLVMEEPDIEIGAGVSSKAMSKRVGPESGKGGGGGGGGGRHKGSKQFRKGGGADAAMGAGGGYGASHQERFNSPRPQEQVAYQPPPPVPNFGFQFALPGSAPPY
ncbi:hypothetical protein CAC42_3789 [Sphaceloma murrayae]|uniref:Protein NRD1 n=1 Tax=Sphaceloma murrayae TaxID=2082308 RepID=A0A2K1QI27_9PEZI|nr:hypothetical protein CAC42_3789 [Sphaceloma murrayae]